MIARQRGAEALCPLVLCCKPPREGALQAV